MAEPVVIDSNLLIVSNARDVNQATPECIGRCVKFLENVRSAGRIVIDDAFIILNEYMRKVSPSGQPGVGDAFLKWVLTNQANVSRCSLVGITPHPIRGFAEFPEDPDLAKFDRSDRKFVAVALAHPDRPPIANAVDSDWVDAHIALARNGVRVQQICDLIPSGRERKKSSGGKRPGKGSGNS